jgi:hypothetical protein
VESSNYSSRHSNCAPAPGREGGASRAALPLVLVFVLGLAAPAGVAAANVIKRSSAHDAQLQGGAQLGYSVAGAGDVNGDGFADVVVGAPFFDAQQANEGRAYLYLGSDAGLSPEPAWTADPADESGALFGWTVASAGDVNDDGFSDVLVSAVGHGPTFVSEGRVYLFLGGPGGLGSAPAWTVDPTDQSAAGFGGSVARAGDLNGDGYDDVVIGASLYDEGPAPGNDGRVFVYLGGPSGLRSSPDFVEQVLGDSTEARLGASVSAAGDFDCDGRDDFVATVNSVASITTSAHLAVFFDVPLASQRRIYVGTSIPWAVALVGDVNGDGCSDLVLGNDRFYGSAGEGAVVLYAGRTRDGGVASVTWNFGIDRSRFGAAVAGAGDVNGDGHPDLLVGAPEHGELPGTAYEGRAYLFLGNGRSFDGTAAWVEDPVNQEFSKFGASVAGAGDIDGDGFADFVVGAPEYDGAQAKQGRFFVYYGTGLPRPADAGSLDGGGRDGGDDGGTSGSSDGGGTGADGGSQGGADGGTRRFEALRLGCDCSSAGGGWLLAGLALARLAVRASRPRSLSRSSVNGP